jgi:hypothetical protein
VQLLPDVRHFFLPKIQRLGDRFGCTKVREVVFRVDEKYRVALEFFYLNNLSYTEIVDTLEYRLALSGRECPVVSVANFEQGGGKAFLPQAHLLR